MTTTKPAGFSIADIPVDVLKDKLAWLESGLNPIDHMDCAALLMATCDLRTREVLALQWRDVDLDGLALDVRRTCDELGNPRPAREARAVRLPLAAAKGLQKRRTVQTAYFKRYARHLVACDCGSAALAPEAPVVSTPEGKPIRPKAFARWWHDKRADFEMCGWTLSELHAARAIVAASDAEAGR